MSELHFETVSPALLELIKQVNADVAFKNFRLCGGTALALQNGHRISNDADFVSEKSFDVSELTVAVNNKFKNVTDLNSGKHGLFLKINNIKVDFLSWNIPFIREKVIVDEIALTNVEEIIAMKLFAILQRGEKKDYMDIVSLLDKFDLNKMISFYKERHKGSDDLTVIRFLSSFSDIDLQPEPVMLNGLKWEDGKTILADAIKVFIAE